MSTVELGPKTGPGGWGAQASSLLPRVRQALGSGPKRVALLLPPLQARPRRAARLLLQEQARMAQGVMLEAASGELLLLGGQEAALRRLATELRGLGLPTGRTWPLQDAAGAASLLRWAAHAAPPPRPEPAAAERLLAMAQGLALDRVAVRRSLVRFGSGQTPHRLALYHAVSRRRLTRALGSALAADPELLEETALLIEPRLAAAPPAAAAPPVPVLLRPGPAVVPAPGAAIALLPLATLADPAGFAVRCRDLLAAGWAGIGLDGLDAALLATLDPAGLPGDGPVLLRWSPRLADRAARLALRGRIDPARLVLTGCTGVEALEWGLEAGIVRFLGPALDAVLAATAGRPA